MLTYFTSNLDFAKLTFTDFATRISLIETRYTLRIIDCLFTHTLTCVLQIGVNSNVLYISPSFLAFHISLILAFQQIKISEISTLFQPITLQIICILTISSIKPLNFNALFKPIFRQQFELFLICFNCKTSQRKVSFTFKVSPFEFIIFSAKRSVCVLDKSAYFPPVSTYLIN